MKTTNLEPYLKAMKMVKSIGKESLIKQFKETKKRNLERKPVKMGTLRSML